MQSHLRGAGALLLALSLGGVAEAAPRVLTLPEALEFARVHRPLVRASQSALAAREADARVPSARWLPQVGVTVQLVGGTDNESTAAYVGGGPVTVARVGGTRAYSGTWSPQPTTLAAVTARQEVYDFGRIAADRAAALAGVDEARADRDATALDVDLAVEETYAAVLAAKEMLAATDEAYKHATTGRDFAKAGVDRELRPPIDLSRAQAELSTIEARRIRARGEVEAARAAFASVLGSDDEFDVAPLAPDQSASPTLNEVLHTAAARNPALIAALARLHAQKAATSAISRQLLPDISAVAGLAGAAGGAVSSADTRPYGNGWLPDQQNWWVGAVLSWNVFDATILRRRDAARRRIDERAAERDETALVVSLATRRAWIDVQTALEALPSLQQAVDAARLNLQQSEARFKAELGNIVELSDAETTLIEAELNLAVGRFAVTRARAALTRAVGQPALAAAR
jgi:outer membrane protein